MRRCVMVQLTPEIKVNSERVSMVSICQGHTGLVCRIIFECGTVWEITGEYAEPAWAGWMAYWRGRRQTRMKVKMPCAFIERLKNADALVIGPAPNM